jgi:hypothetical protein
VIEVSLGKIPTTRVRRLISSFARCQLRRRPRWWKDLLNLVVNKAHHKLGSAPRWPFATTIERTVHWYRQVHETDAGALACCQNDLNHYLTTFSS